MGCISKVLDAATFDQKLLLDGKWKAKEIERIEQWIKKTDEEKKAEASRLVAFLIESLLGKDFSTRGKQSSKNLGEMFFRLEELIETTKGGIARKFYRDHLNHMLRVTILARAVARKVKCLDLDEDTSKLVTLATLFHDIAYPLAEIDKSFREITSAMKKCYRSITYPETIVSYDMTIVTKLLENLNLLPGMKTSDLGEYFAEHNHGLLGAMEFLQYVKEEAIHKYASVVDAITYHDPAFSKQISLLDRRILSLLVICDEMQEWGRLATFEEDPTISEIKEFRLTRNGVYGKFVWDKSSIVSPLRQIYSKGKSLERLSFSGFEKNFSVNLRFALPDYSCFNYRDLEVFLQELFVSWKIPTSIFRNFSKQIDVKLYEQMYFGLSTEGEEDLIASLEREKLVEASIFSQPLFLSSVRNEVLYVGVHVGTPQELKLALDKHGFKMTLTGAENFVVGELVGQQENRAVNISGRIIGELLILNLVLEHLYLRKKGVDKNARGSIAPRNKIEELLKRKKYPKEKIELIRAADNIRECLKRQGLYVFL